MMTCSWFFSRITSSYDGGGCISCMEGVSVGPQIWAEGGGGGGKPAPGNQEERGSAERIVISGRLLSLSRSRSLGGGVSDKEVDLFDVLLMAARIEESGP